MELEEYWILSEIRRNLDEKAELISEWPNHEAIGDAVFHWRPIGDQPGFYGVVTRLVASDMDDCEYVEVLMVITAYYDGVRHLHFCRQRSPDELGYDYYPDIGTWCLLFERLKQVEKELCDPG